ncbi:SRPBCC family protein [Actinomadura physcomitrii]|uniref:SRPBCC family protein n=1 Tax=Actinomadura physcomitrii TaxID=2650748 RepID=UPI002E265403
MGVDEAWKVLLDVERIAPCMPGATLESADADTFTGRVKVRLGPISVVYRGKASFTEKDEDAHRVVIAASGREARGSGTAKATITATLTAQGPETLVLVRTDLAITGRPAQFGRGILADVSSALLGQFADALAEEVAAPPVTMAPTEEVSDAVSRADLPSAGEVPTTPSARPSASADLDLIRTAAWPVAKRALPLLGAAFVLLAWVARRRGR